MEMIGPPAAVQYTELARSVRPPLQSTPVAQRQLLRGLADAQPSRRRRSGGPQTVIDVRSTAGWTVPCGFAAVGCASLVRLSRQRFRRNALHVARISGRKVLLSFHSLAGRSGSQTARRATEDDREELMALTLKELKQRCKDRGVKVGGKKNELVDRLLGETDDEMEEAESIASEEEASPELPDVVRQREEEPENEDKADKLIRDFVAALEEDRVDQESLEAVFEITKPRVGEIVKGTVSSTVEWGAFVELEESGWTGLLHITEMADSYIENIADYLRPGDEVECVVIKSQSDRPDRLSLSIRQLHDPSAVDRSLINTPSPNTRLRMPRMDATTAAIQRLERRISAIEGVLLQLGHGQVLRAAQEEVANGVSPTVPPLPTLLSGIPELSSDLAAKRQAKAKEEQRNIDAILQEMSDKEGWNGKMQYVEEDPEFGDDLDGDAGDEEEEGDDDADYEEEDVGLEDGGMEDEVSSYDESRFSTKAGGVAVTVGDAAGEKFF
eukprot:TRINITY_DN16946_c0_g1_i1.p1 TRINITY_DN16946_c0_g1~~TRINITY_DN16946_c0_g1_i1.p1  ORF type:complete len:498 (-),score=154.39 TRINITY_DN16946_c0_g1_i1:41-1534(-)